jgi:hypothetical protein
MMCEPSLIKLSRREYVMNENLFKKRAFAVVVSLFAPTGMSIAMDRVSGLVIAKAVAEECIGAAQGG